MTISVETITPVTYGGAGAGNTYKFKVTHNGVTTLSTCERDVAYDYKLAGLPVPEQFQGPYDCFGNKE